MIPLVDKKDVKRRKRMPYKNIRKKAEELAPKIHQRFSGDYVSIVVRTREVAKMLGMEDKSDSTIYTALRFILFYEGIYVTSTYAKIDAKYEMRSVRSEDLVKLSDIDNDIKRTGEHEHLMIMRRVNVIDGFSHSFVQKLSNLELDGWQIKRYHGGLCSRFVIKRDHEHGNVYILESDGDISFDKRNITEEQAIRFVQYMSSKHINDEQFRTDFIYNTPINIVLPDGSKVCDQVSLKDVGREFRVTRSGEDEFVATSIYGKQCQLREYDIDQLIKGCDAEPMLDRFDKALSVERIPERINILKKILPDIKTKNIAMIDDKELVIVNSAGKFHISLVDGALYKVVDDDKKYVCVGPVSYTKGVIIYEGVKYELDKSLNAILAKALMLLEEQYPDDWTKAQCMM